VTVAHPALPGRPDGSSTVDFMIDGRLILTFSAIFLLLVWIASLIPLASVLIEFPMLACDSNRVGWFFARYWGSLFIYPPFLSCFALSAAYVPATTAVMYGLINRFYLITALTFMVLIVAVVCFVEFSDSPFAPFEISRGNIRHHNFGMT
jgi:hypothetical protein